MVGTTYKVKHVPINIPKKITNAISRWLFAIPAVENINVQLEHALRSNNSEQGLDNLEGIVGVGFAMEEIQEDE